MSVASTEDYGVAFLERLLMLSEKNPDRSRPASASPDYNQLSTAKRIHRFEERMVAAERAGSIEICKGKKERRHLIERVRVTDPVVLASHLGRDPSATIAQKMKNILEPIAETGESWVQDLLHKMSERWVRGESAYRITPSSTDQAREFFLLLSAISKNEAHGLDTRTFSLRTVGDSKAFDRHNSRLLQTLSGPLGKEGLPAEAIWASIGLERYAHPVHVRGGIVAEDEAGILVHGRTAPFASFHPELSNRIRLYSNPTALITIENYASFNRYAREIDDGSLAVYTGGFGSSGVIQLLNAILALSASDMPVFHWGDIDPGGLRIFRFLEESLTRQPKPHLMEQYLAEAYGRPATRDLTLSSVAKTESAIAGLALWLAESENVMHLEQEALDPKSPLSKA